MNELSREKALTVRQPWAWAIFVAGKKIENRSWVPSYRGRLWIHTSKQLILNGSSMQAEENRWAIAMISAISGINFFDSSNEVAKATGAIIGSVDLIGCRSPRPHPENPWHMPGQVGLVLKNPVLLETPIPCKGNLGIWDCSKYFTEVSPCQ